MIIIGSNLVIGMGYEKWFVTAIILDMGSVNEIRRYIVTSSLIGWAHTQNEPFIVSQGPAGHCVSRKVWIESSQQCIIFSLTPF